MNLKTLLLGAALIVAIGLAGFLYRSIVEQPTGPIACTADAKICPDGTGLGRVAPLCAFPACPPPNVELASIGLAFALPAGYVAAVLPDSASLVAFSKTEASGVESNLIVRRFTLASSTTAADFIRGNAIMDASGAPAPATAFSSVVIGSHRFSVVTLGRFEGVVDTVYYLSRESDVLRFDALSRNVLNWTDPALESLSLPANQDVRTLLGTLQGN